MFSWRNIFQKSLLCCVSASSSSQWIGLTEIPVVDGFSILSGVVCFSLRISPSLSVSLMVLHLLWPSMKRRCHADFWGHISWLSSHGFPLLCLSCGFSRIEKGCIFASAAVVEINVLQVKCFQRNHPLLEQRIPFSDFRFFSSNFCLPQVLGQGPNGYVYMQIMQEYANIMQVTPLMAAVLVGKPFGAPLKGLAQFLFTVCGLLWSFQKVLNKNTQPC